MIGFICMKKLLWNVEFNSNLLNIETSCFELFYKFSIKLGKIYINFFFLHILANLALERN